MEDGPNEPHWIEAAVGESGVARLSLWVHAYEDSKRVRRRQSPVAFPSLATDIGVVNDLVLSSGLLDIEVVTDVDTKVDGTLVIVVGHELGGDQTPSRVTRPSCVVLERRMVRGVPVWSPKEEEAERYLGRRWRSAHVWAALAHAQSVSGRWVSGLIPVRDIGLGGVPVQWELKLGYSEQRQAEVFRGVTLDLLRQVVPVQDEEGYRSTDADLERALSIGIDLHDVMEAYRAASAAEEFVRAARGFFQHRRRRGEIEMVVTRLDRDDAVRYWSERGFERPLHVEMSTRVAGRILPTQFTVVRAEAIDPTVRVALAAVRRVRLHVEGWLRRLEEIETLEVTASPLEEAKRERVAAFLDAPRVTLQGHDAQLRTLLGADTGRDDVPLEVLTTTSRPAGDLRRLALRMGDGLQHGAADLDPLQLEATNELYEAWCFLRVVGALQSIGFRRNALGELWSASELYYAGKDTPFDLVLPGRMEGRLVVRKEPRYRSPATAHGPEEWYGRETRYEEGLTTKPQRGHELEPDVALEFWGAREGDHPGGLDIVTLDATSSDQEERWIEKYKYYDLLRAFEGREVPGGGGGSAVRIVRDDHGESPRVVRAAWALCPGGMVQRGQESVEAYQGPHPAMPGGQPDQVWRHGYYVLTADDESFEGWLEALLAGLGLIQGPSDRIEGRIESGQ